MNKITVLEPDAHGPAVAELQAALQLLLAKAALRVPQHDHDLGHESFRTERANATYGEQTRKLVSAFQEQRQVTPTGRVDLETAAQLNVLLKRVGALSSGRTQPPASHKIAVQAVQKLMPIFQKFPLLGDDAALRRFVRLFEDPGADLRNWARLASHAGMSAPQIDELKLALEWAALTGHDPYLIVELQALRRSGRIRSGHDIVAFGTDEWKAIVRRASAARATGHAMAEADVDARVAAIEKRLQQAYPTAYVARTLAVPPAIDLALVRRIVAANPTLDLSRPVFKTLRFDGFSADQRTAAEISLEALRREINAYPDFDYRAALQPLAGAARDVAQFLERATDFDLRTVPVAKYA